MRMVNRFTLVCAALCVSGVCAADVLLTPTNGEIVVATGTAKPVEFAVREMNGIFARAFGVQLPVVRTPTAGRVSIVLGDCDLSREAGIDVSKLARDAFVVRVTANRVFIAGRDDQTCDLMGESVVKGRVVNGERATVFGVYDFLERHLGVRFYFPGRLGTIVPRASEVRLPEGECVRAPVFTVRNVYFHGDGVVPGETEEVKRRSWKALSWLRLRMQTQDVRCCHGQRGFSFPERFHKTHPEYFALVRRDGKLVRDVGERIMSDFDVQMCHTSGLWGEMYEDCKAYLSGRPAAERGIRPEWGHDALG